MNELLIGIRTLYCLLLGHLTSSHTLVTERVIKRRGQEGGRQRPFVEKLSKAQSAQSAARCVQAASDMGLCVCVCVGARE